MSHSACSLLYVHRVIVEKGRTDRDSQNTLTLSVDRFRLFLFLCPCKRSHKSSRAIDLAIIV